MAIPELVRLRLFNFGQISSRVSHAASMSCLKGPPGEGRPVFTGPFQFG